MTLRQMAAIRVTTSITSATLAGIWVNLYTDELNQFGYISSFINLSWSNVFLGMSVGGIVLGEAAARRWRMMQQDEFINTYKVLQQRQQRVLESTLKIVCDLISSTLQIPCNARYFVAEKDHDERYYIRQDRDLAVLNIRMPREFGFTRIYVDTPHIVSGQAFRDRVPLFEELPIDHVNRYDQNVGRMIEPEQRWVLACPVLRLDPKTNSHDLDHPPHGVIVFYGTDLPAEPEASEKVQRALAYSQQFAEQMSHVLNMLELSVELEGRNDGPTDGDA
ncbi:hypothetical protein [Streptomyces winkii]|uniref:hypothetical protein n=1 Tax=Streptomyces winkii TaxID=3051178 RepID=UPI0028D3DCCC|nr:hypothetical protein [Streptomyces sp. DSM 40971]